MSGRVCLATQEIAKMGMADIDALDALLGKKEW